MSERKIRIRVPLDVEEFTECRLSKAVQILTEAYESIPEEHRENATFSAFAPYASVSVEIDYVRPLSQEEKERQDRYDKEAAETKKAKDLALLAELKAKYEKE